VGGGTRRRLIEACACGGRAGQVSVAVLIDKFVSATALIKFEEVARALGERKAKEVLLPALSLELRRRLDPRLRARDILARRQAGRPAGQCGWVVRCCVLYALSFLLEGGCHPDIWGVLLG
jgi:hypothetical protein